MKRPWLALLGLAAVLAVLALYFGHSKKASEPGAPAPTAEPPDPRHAGPAPTVPTTPKAAPVAVPPKKSPGDVVVRGGWGGKPGEFGRRRDPESNPEGPMAVIIGPGGEVDVIDQINRRVQRFKNGKLVGNVSIGGDTVQDAAEGSGGRMLLLDRLADRNVQVYGPDGKLQNEVPIVGKGIPEGGGVTGVFGDDDGIYVEREHNTVVRIAGPDGTPDPNRPELLGRPSRDGRLLLQAQRAPAGVIVHAVDRQSGQPAWAQTVELDAPVLHLVMLDSDRHGMTYVAADVGHESQEAPYSIVDEKIVIVRLGAGGVPRGALSVPPMPTADETFRPITVDDDGNVYVMTAGEAGLTVTRYSFP